MSEQHPGKRPGKKTSRPANQTRSGKKPANDGTGPRKSSRKPVPKPASVTANPSAEPPKRNKGNTGIKRSSATRHANSDAATSSAKSTTTAKPYPSNARQADKNKPTARPGNRQSSGSPSSDRPPGFGPKHTRPGDRTSDQRRDRPPQRHGPVRTNDSDRNRKPAQGGGATAKSGMPARRLALTLIEAVIRDRKTLDNIQAAAFADPKFSDLDGRDKAFARRLATTVLRHHADLDRTVNNYLEKPLTGSAERIRIILLMGAAELLLLGTPPHAAISSSVDLTKISQKTRHFEKLANAVLRRTSETGRQVYDDGIDASANFPDWMIESWSTAYGAETANLIAAASLTEASLDITAKGDAAALAEPLDATVLPTGTLRRAAGGRIDELPGFDDGEWWVQDAASALPAQLIGITPDMHVLDLCAAPGGKTAQLCAAGAEVTAVDVSETRLARLRTNLRRLKLEAHIIGADATTWRGTTLFHAILLDAPCTATGTIRRHPDILHLKPSDDSARLADAQRRLLINAAIQLAPGGTLLYCTCSLQPAESEDLIRDFLANPPARLREITFARKSIRPEEVGGYAQWITSDGDLRTLPHALPNPDRPEMSGIDGFYAARLMRTDEVQQDTPE